MTTDTPLSTTFLANASLNALNDARSVPLAPLPVPYTFVPAHGHTPVPMLFGMSLIVFMTSIVSSP